MQECTYAEKNENKHLDATPKREVDGGDLDTTPGECLSLSFFSSPSLFLSFSLSMEMEDRKDTERKKKWREIDTDREIVTKEELTAAAAAAEGRRRRKPS